MNLKSAKQKIIENLNNISQKDLGKILDIMNLNKSFEDEISYIQILNNSADFYTDNNYAANFLTTFIFSDYKNNILKSDSDSYKHFSIILQKQMYNRGKKLK